MITRVATVSAPPYHCGICRRPEADYFVDTQVQTDEGALFICSDCLTEINRTAGEYVTVQASTELSAQLVEEFRSKKELLDQFIEADRILKLRFGLDYKSILEINRTQEELTETKEEIRKAQAVLQFTDIEIKERQTILHSYDSQLDAANRVIEEKLKEVDILSLPLTERLERYYGSNGAIPIGVSSEPVEDGGDVRVDGPSTSESTEASTLSF